MTTPRETVERYFEAFAAGRFSECRPLLADDFHFQGPLDTFDDPDRFVAAITQLGQAMEEARPLKLFDDGADVCLLWEFVFRGSGQRVDVAEWFQVSGGRIRSLRIMFDARPFAAMMGR